MDSFKYTLMKDEGFRSKVYLDHLGYPTIGYGTRIDELDVTKEEAERWLLGLHTVSSPGHAAGPDRDVGGAPHGIGRIGAPTCDTTCTMRLSDQIRKAINGCGLSRYRIAAESGVEESSLSRFMAKEHGLTTDSLDKIADVLRLELVCSGPRPALLRKYGIDGG